MLCANGLTLHMQNVNGDRKTAAVHAEFKSFCSIVHVFSDEKSSFIHFSV